MRHRRTTVRTTLAATVAAAAVLLSACGSNAAPTAAPPAAGSSGGSAAAASPVLPVTSDPITNTATAKTLAIDKLQVENNTDASGKTVNVTTCSSTCATPVRPR